MSRQRWVRVSEETQSEPPCQTNHTGVTRGPWEPLLANLHVRRLGHCRSLPQTNQPVSYLHGRPASDPDPSPRRMTAFAAREADGVRVWADGAVARVAMARPEKRNAQDRRMLYALNAAFDMAMEDAGIRVVVLSGDGPHFCSGHDLDDLDAPPPARGCAAVTASRGYDEPGAAGWMAREEEMYLGLHRRWRDLPKPTIAMVQGACVAGGLMTAWVCDLIVAADDASFSDPVVGMGMNAHEWFVHPWELGARKAKELLFTAEPVSAQDAWRLGMVNHVVPAADLDPFTVELAERIARHDPLALKLAKRSVNHALDAQGQAQAVDYAFALHHLAHTHHRANGGGLVSRDRPAERGRRGSGGPGGY